jgi:hypothetical protein
MITVEPISVNSEITYVLYIHKLRKKCQQRKCITLKAYMRDHTASRVLYSQMMEDISRCNISSNVFIRSNFSSVYMRRFASSI